MRKNFKWLLALVAMVASVNLMAAKTATYTFNTDDGLKALGITKPASSNGTDLNKDASYKVGEVSMTATHGGTNTRVWNASGTTDLRIYKNGGTLTFSVSDDYKITQIVLTGGTINVFSVDTEYGSYSSGTWTPKQGKTVTSVVLTATNTGKINTITVTYDTNSGSSCEDLNAPSVLSATNITMSGATLSWTGDDNASSYTVMVGDKAYENVTSSSLIVSDLQPETKYTWSVQAIGNGTDYCSSAQVNGDPFTTAADPNVKKVTYNFNDANAYPQGFPTASGTSTTSATEFTISGNRLTINAPGGYYIINSNKNETRGLFFGKSSTTLSSTAYLEFPAFKNYKLTKVVATTTSGVAGSVSMNIYNTSWTEVSTEQSTVGSTKKAFTFDIASDKQALNAAYRLASNSSGTKNLQFDNIVLTYAYVAPQSYNVTLSTDPANVGTITAKVDNVAIGAKVEEGKIVTLSATPNDAHAYRFKEWQSDDVTIEENAFEMPNKAVSITAVFEQLYAVSITTAGEGSGTATINGGTETIYVGADDEITLVAEAAAGSEFVSWSATGTIVFDDETDATTTALAETAGTISATFNKKECTILDTPQNVQVDKTYSGAKLTWDAVTNADYYEVYIKKGADDVENDMVEGTEYTISSPLSANTEYSYSIIATSEDEETYCASNPAEDVFTTADYPAATLTLSENGDTRDVTGLKVNTPFNLPDCEVTCDKVFVGWSESNTDHSNLLAAGSPYTMNETTGTLYAWFAKETPGETTDVYTLNIPKNGSNSNYATYYDITYMEIGWKIPGNQNIGAYVKLGGKLSAATDRYLYSKTAIASKVNRVIANHGTKDAEITVNSVTLDVYSTAAKASTGGAGDISSVSGTYIASGNTTFECPSNADWTGRFYRLTYNLSSSDAGNNKGLILNSIKMQSNDAPTYSDYSLTCSAKANAPIFDLAEGTYTEAKELNISAKDDATIYYTDDKSDPSSSATRHEYTGAIQLNTYGKVTIKAIAILDGKDPSDVTSAEYMMDLPFTSLQQLAETEVASGSTITISFPKTAIKNIAGTHGVYFDIQKEGKDIEIYCKDKAIDDTWEAGGNLSAENLTCKWVRYPETGNLTCWELTPSDWSKFEYSNPDPYTSVSDLYAADLEDGSKVYLNITNAYVHAKTYTSPNNFVYVQDGGVGIVLRTTETIADENIGKLMTAKIVGNLAYSNGRPQIAVTSMSEVSYTAGSRPAAVATTLSASEEASQILSLVKIDGYFAQSQDKQAKTAVITENADGSGASYTIYNLFGALKNIPESDKAINVKGLFYKKVESNVTSYSIVPVLVEDVALVTPADALAASVNKGSEDDTNPTEVGNGEIITITPASGFTASYILNDAAEKTITASEEKVTMTANSTLIIKSSRDYYDTTLKTYYYKINEALTYHSITKPIGNYTCELSAPSAKLNDEVTITFAMNEHWYLDGVTVKNAADKTVEFEATKVSDTEYRFAMPAYDVTLSTATHSDPTYRIEYQTGGKHTTGGSAPTEGSKYEGDEVTLQPNTWTVNDFVFDKWKVIYETGDAEPKEQHEVEVIDGKFRMPPYNVKVIAQWVAVYAVTYAKGTATSATGSVTEEPQKEGSVIKLKANAFKATGYSFTGWKASTDGEIYQPDADFTMPAQAVTFTAQWDVAEYKKDGTWELVTSADQLETGKFYVIGNSQYGKTMTSTSAGSTNKRLTAIETEYSDDKVEGDKGIIMKSNLPEETVIFQLGKENEAWTFMNVATEQYYHTGDHSNPEWLTTGNKALWSLNYNSTTLTMKAIHGSYTSDSTLQYYHEANNASNCGFRPYKSSQKAIRLYRFYPTARKVYFKANAGEDDVTNMPPEMQRADHITNMVTIPNVTPERTGYTFTKWNSATTGQGTHSAQPNETIELWQAECTLYAIWTANTPLLTVANVEHGVIKAKPNSMDEMAEGASVEVEYGKSVTISYKNDEEGGYAFKAWDVYETSNPANKIELTKTPSTTSFTMPDFPVTISAEFESIQELEFTVTYDANGGEGTMEGNPFTYKYNSKVTPSDNKDALGNDIFTKNLCTFNGWKDETGNSINNYFFIKKNTTLYAQWKGSGATYYLDKLAEGNISVKEGAVPQGSTATCVNTYTGNIDQVTVNHTLTITLSGYAGLVVTNITADIKSNSSTNSGKLDITIGEVNVFDKTYENLGAQGKSQYQNCSFADYGFVPVVVKENEDIVILVQSLIEKSAYIQNITIEYEDIPEETTVRSGLTPGQYTTYCEPQTVLAGTYTGATFWNIESKTIMTTMGDERLSSITIVQHEGALVAGVPYIMLPESDVLTGKKCSKAVAEPAAEDAHNGLVGVFATTMFDNFSGDAATIDALAAARGIYIISDGTLYLCGNNCGVYANRAYILNSAIEDKSATTPPAAPRRVIGNPNGTPTTLNGLNGNQAGKAQKALIDGHIYILRDNKMYNAQGLFVK